MDSKVSSFGNLDVLATWKFTDRISTVGAGLLKDRCGLVLDISYLNLPLNAF